MRYNYLTFGLVFGSISCASPSPQENLTASDIAWKDGNIAMALASLEAKCGVEKSSKPDVSEDLLEELETLKKEISLLQEQVERVYEVVDEVQADGVGHAKLVPYDPRQTVLQAKTVQEAIDEMMGRVKVLERSVLDDLGQPGPGLFEIPKDTKGSKGGKHPPPNGGQGGPNNGGPKGPNQGGGQNGPPGNPGGGGCQGPNGPPG